MSTLPDNEFDLEKLFLPAWAQEDSSAKYSKYEGETERFDRRSERRGPRPPRREGPGRRDEKRPRGERRGPPSFDGNRPRPAEGQRPRGGERHDRRDRPERREPPA